MVHAVAACGAHTRSSEPCAGLPGLVFREDTVCQMCSFVSLLLSSLH